MTTETQEGSSGGGRNALHLDCGGDYKDIAWVQFTVHTAYFNQVDSTKKEAIKT